MSVVRKLDLVNLVRELAENRVSALEIVREALSNAKDHGAGRVFIASRRDPPNRVSLMLIDDGEGMDHERLEAFWGVGASVKPPGSIGYKGHGTKLYFTCARLSVATRSASDAAWVLTTLEQPLRTTAQEVTDSPLPENHPLWAALLELGLLGGTGTAISIEDLVSDDRAELLSRRHIESFCDWFTVIGDVRSGLFESRREFHRNVAERSTQLEYLRPQDAELRPIEVHLRLNGERDYRPVGLGRGAKDHEFLAAWREDVEEFQDRPGLLALGHRFADFHESKRGATRTGDDMSALRLTDPTSWTTDDGIAIVAHVEGHRRQRQTYLEASWQGKRDGIYGFEQRFGLWLCRDFVPVAQRNDLLRKVLDRALPRRAKFEIRSLRNWKVFVNDQGFRPTANRNDIANHGAREARIAEALEGVLRVSLREKAFSEWIGRLQAAALERAQNREIEQIDERREEVRTWMNRKVGRDDIEIADIDSLPRLDPAHSLRLRAPRSEQELFFVYALLSGRHEMPLRLLEYDASQGVDAIGMLLAPKLVSGRDALVRVELKLEVEARNPIHHFFEAIDLILCWRVGREGEIWEETAETVGMLRKRTSPTLSPPLDTHEIVYTAGERERVIPIITLAELFRLAKAKPTSG
jgi:hypothetical protein